MNVEYTGRHFEVTPAIRKDVESGLVKIRKILGNKFETKVVLAVEKHRHKAEITISPRNGPLVGLAQAGHNAGLWPVASEQTGTLLVVLAVAIKTREPLRIPVRAAGLPVLAGASGMAATLAYFYATHFSMLAIAAVLVSLYPGVTVLLARTLLHERFTPAQRAGLGLCALAIAAIALN